MSKPVQTQISPKVKEADNNSAPLRAPLLPPRATAGRTSPGFHIKNSTVYCEQTSRRHKELSRLQVPPGMGDYARILYGLLDGILTLDEKENRCNWMKKSVDQAAFYEKHKVTYKTLNNRCIQKIRWLKNVLFIWLRNGVRYDISKEEIARLRQDHQHLPELEPTSTDENRLYQLLALSVCETCVASQEYLKEARWLLHNLGGGPANATDMVIFQQSTLTRNGGRMSSVDTRGAEEYQPADLQSTGRTQAMPKKT